MGSIKDCTDGGIPASLLVPIRPWDKPDADGKNAGKSPAVVGNNGQWVGLPNWQRGVLPEDLKMADEMGGNAGLALGNPDSASDNALWNFAAIDIDLNDGEEVHRHRLVHGFSNAWAGQSLWVRETVPHRAMLLVRITNTQSVGRKTVYHLTYKNPANKDAPEISIGKIELLATGQQAVIAGTHASGNRINWRCLGQDGDYRVPVLDTGYGLPPLPAFPSFPDLTESISSLLTDLSKMGYRYDCRIGGGGEAVPDAYLAPPWLTVEKLCALIDRMPNGAEVDRDFYVEVMMAIAASRCGIAKHRGELTEAMNMLVATTAAKWAAKWPNHNLEPGQNPFELELAKWQSDWSNYTGGFQTSYSRLMGLAGELGITDAAAEAAQEEFTADPAAPPMLPTDPDDLPFTSPRSGETMVPIGNSAQSDFAVIDYLRRERNMDQNASWIAHSSKWMLWDSKRGWISKDDTGATIDFTIMQELKRYTALHQATGTPQEWKAAAVNSMLSVGKMERVSRGLARCVAVSLGDINQAPEFLQTPDGTYNLNDLELVPLRLRWQMRDIRSTNVSPNGSTHTPLFDSLLDMLADHNAEVVEWLWHYFGYALIGNPKAQCFLVLWGAGGNGKGTLAKVLEYIFGGYCTPLENRVLLESGKGRHPTELNMIRHKRLAVVAEMPRDEKWNESTLKKLTGEDQIHARNMNEDMTAFTSEAAIIIHCNELPAFSRITPAILRRFRMVGTMNTPEKVDPRYADKIITQEASAILWRCMKYAKRVLDADIALPELPSVMMHQQSEVLAENDHFFGWLQSECLVGLSDEIGEPMAVLKDRYEKWLQRAAKNNPGEMVADKVNMKVFKQLLKARGVRVASNNGNPIRKNYTHPANGVQTVEEFAGGIKLKVKVA